MGLASEAVQFQGKIKSVDKKTRSVVVVGPNGNEIMLNLSDEVKNFDQIKKGDLVTLTMMHAVALELRKVANNGIRELGRGGTGQFRVHNRSTGTVHFILDVNGVFK